MIKKGFLFIELSICLIFTFFLTVLLGHYIIEIKKIQQKSFVRIKAVSLLRNCIERCIADKSVQYCFDADVKNAVICTPEDALLSSTIKDKKKQLWMISLPFDHTESQGKKKCTASLPIYQER